MVRIKNAFRASSRRLLVLCLPLCPLAVSYCEVCGLGRIADASVGNGLVGLTSMTCKYNQEHEEPLYVSHESLNKSPLDEADIQRISNATYITFLSGERDDEGRVVGGNLDDDDVRAVITHARKVESLDLACTGISNEILRTIGEAEQLEYLSLSDTDITDEGLAHLGRLKNLRILDLSYCSVTSEGLTHLRSLKDLRSLDLTCCPVTSQGISQLNPLESLEYLGLGSTKVDDLVFDHLVALSRLEELELGCTSVTDNGVGRLESLKCLRILKLNGTEVSGETVEGLKLAIPALRVYR